jgi:hypothetical protein
VLTEPEASSLEQKLSAAMTYVTHEHPQKAAAAVDDLINEVRHISQDKEPTVKSMVSELAQSADLLQEQLRLDKKMTETIWKERQTKLQH